MLRSSDAQVTVSEFGSSGDVPLSSDINGDGRADLAVYGPSTGTWYVAKTTGIPGQNFDAIQFGVATDIPVPADYDGDGKSDIAIFRDGQWWILASASGSVSVEQFGLATDRPLPAVYSP